MTSSKDVDDLINVDRSEKKTSNLNQIKNISYGYVSPRR